MRTGLILAVLSLAAIGASDAHAQAVMVPPANPIPLPPMQEPLFQVGIRY